MHNQKLVPILFLFTVACGGAPSDETATPPARFLSIGTAPPGGAFFVVGGALAEVLNSHSPAGWQVTAEATKGTQENIRRLATGEIDVALANAAVTYFAVRGTEGWDHAYPMRTLMTLAPNVALFITPASSDIMTLADLEGHRVSVGVAGAGFEFFVRPLLAAHGVTYEDFTPLYGTQSAAVDMLADGSASAAFLGGAVPTGSITQATTSGKMRFVPFDHAKRTELVEQYPFFSPVVVPAGTYPGQEEDFAGLNVGSMQLIAAASLEDELAYSITKTLYEQREAVAQKHPAGKAINPKNVTTNRGSEFHPGAVRYYREIGIWPDAQAAEAEAAPAAEGR